MRSVRSLVLLVTCNTIGGCMPAALYYLFTPRVTLYFALQQAKWGLAYAWCIGSLCFFLMEPVAYRIRRLRRIYQVPAFLLLFAGLAVVGSIPATLIIVLAGAAKLEFMWNVYVHSVKTAIAI